MTSELYRVRSVRVTQEEMEKKEAMVTAGKPMEQELGRAEANSEHRILTTEQEEDQLH